ncbi:hypothetical protein P7C70_g2269, partial [Phenoliferia sp. Uapishka_3]
MYATNPQSFYGAHQVRLGVPNKSFKPIDHDSTNLQQSGAAPPAAQHTSSPPDAYYQGPPAGSPPPQQHQYSQAYGAPSPQAYAPPPSQAYEHASSFLDSHPASSPPVATIQQAQQAYTYDHKSPVVQQQPVAGAQMVVPVPGGSKNALNKPVDTLGKREWSFGLFDCFSDVGNCMLACCVPCLLYGQTKSKAKALEMTNRPAPGGDRPLQKEICVPVIAASLPAFCTAAVPASWSTQSASQSCSESAHFALGTARSPSSLLRNLSRRYGIRESGVDFFVAWCCGCCAQEQHARELELEERSIAL